MIKLDLTAIKVKLIVIYYTSNKMYYYLFVANDCTYTGNETNLNAFTFIAGLTDSSKFSSKFSFTLMLLIILAGTI